MNGVGNSIDDERVVSADEQGASALLVSIVILNWNQSALTIDCVKSVQQGVGGLTCEIIVVDNGSAEAEFQLLEKLPPSVRLISLAENLFFGEANNIGAEAARAEYILLLNNDVLLTQDVLGKLIHVFDDAYFPGAVGPRFLYPDGAVQEAGAFILQNGWTFQQGKNGSRVDDHFRTGNHAVDYCSAACLLLRRDVFLSVGGFDPLFDPAYFEDADLALRLRSVGLFTYFCADADVYHHEGATSSKVWSAPVMNDLVIGNHRKFFDRWRPYLETRLDCDAALPDFRPLVRRPDSTVQASVQKRMLLCASALFMMSTECEDLLKIAAASVREYDITFSASEACSFARIYSLCRNFGIELVNFKVKRFSTGMLTDYECVVFGDGWARHPDVPKLVQTTSAKNVLSRCG